MKVTSALRRIRNTCRAQNFSSGRFRATEKVTPLILRITAPT